MECYEYRTTKVVKTLREVCPRDPVRLCTESLFQPFQPFNDQIPLRWDFPIFKLDGFPGKNNLLGGNPVIFHVVMRLDDILHRIDLDRPFNLTLLDGIGDFR